MPVERCRRRAIDLAPSSRVGRARGEDRRLIDAVGVTIRAVRRQVSVIAVPFLVVCWVLIAWKAGLFTPRSG